MKLAILSILICLVGIHYPVPNYAQDSSYPSYLEDPWIAALRADLKKIFDPNISVDDEGAKTVAGGLGEMIFSSDKDPEATQKSLIESAALIVEENQPSVDFVKDRQKIYEEALKSAAEKKYESDRAQYSRNHFWLSAIGGGLGILGGVGWSIWKDRRATQRSFGQYVKTSVAWGVCGIALGALAGPPIFLHKPAPIPVIQVPDLSLHIEHPDN